MRWSFAKGSIACALAAILLIYSSIAMGKAGTGQSAITRIDKTGWFGCINAADCRALAAKTKDSYASALSQLMAEFLRPDAAPANLPVIHSAMQLAGEAPPPVSGLLDAMARVVLGGSGAGLEPDLPDAGDSESIEAIKLLRSLSAADASKLSARARIIERGSAPAASLGLGQLMLSKGMCAAAKECLEPLLRKHGGNPDVVAAWAEANMDCGEYGRAVFSKLRKINEKHPDDLKILSQLIRHLRHDSRFNEIERHEAMIDASSLGGEDGAALLVELAAARINSDDLHQAGHYLRRALALDPRSPDVYLQLSRLSAKSGKDKADLIAYLKSYAAIAKGAGVREEIRDMVKALEITAQNGN